MTEEALEITKEVAKAVYNDGVKGTGVRTGEIIESVVGLFNNVVFYPVKKANALFKYKLKDFKNELEQKLSSIPEKKLVEPDLMIAGPALEALKYTYDKDELRNMYLNLLTSSMNKDIKDKAHPSYVEIIRQLTPLDAKVFKRLQDLGQVACAHAILKIDNSINGFDYNCFKTVNIIVNNKIVLDNMNRAEGNGIITSIDIQGQVIMQNDFGRSFADTCL